MSDDVYEYIVYDDAHFATIAAVEPRLSERTLTVNGVSKGYCMTGWRIGFRVGPRWLVQAMTRLQGQETNGPSSISQEAAVAALNGPRDFVADHNAAYRRRRDMVVERVNAIPGLSCDPPEGAFYVYVDASELIGRVWQDHAKRPRRCRHPLEVGGVAVAPGTGFDAPPYFRLCFAYEDTVMADACERLVRTVAALRVRL